jgi:hypothetical protein
MLNPSRNPLSHSKARSNNPQLNPVRLEKAGDEGLKKYETIPIYPDFQQGAVQRGIKSPVYAKDSLMGVPIITPKKTKAVE